MNRPTSFTVFGVMNLVFGCLLVIGLLINIVQVSGQDKQVEQVKRQARMAKDPDLRRMADQLEAMANDKTIKMLTNVQLVLSLLSVVLLIASAIGLLGVKAWGRTLAIFYAGYSILYTIALVIINFTIMMPKMPDFRGVPGASGMMKGMMIGVSIFYLIWLVYPILLLVFMNKPLAKRAVQGGGRPEDPNDYWQQPPGGYQQPGGHQQPTDYGQQRREW